VTLARLREFIREPEAVFWSSHFTAARVRPRHRLQVKGETPVHAGVVDAPGRGDRGYLDGAAS
jgi:hypothetical protein